MSVYEDIINGTYKKKKEENSVYNSIINGTYKTAEQRKQQMEEEKAQKQNKISTYNNIKNNTLKEVGEEIKIQNENKKKKEEAINNEIKQQINNINTDFNNQYKQTVNLPTAKNTSLNKVNNNSASNYRNTILQETSKKILPTNIRLSTAEEKNNFNELKNGDMYKLSNGAIDDRSEIQRVKDATIDNIVKPIGNNIVAPIGNAGIGIIQSIGNIVNYEDQAFKFGSRMLGRAITKNEQAGDILGNLIYEKKGRELITGVDSDRYNRDMQTLKNWSNETIQKNIENADNPVSKKIAELAPSVGQNILPMAVTAVNPFAGTTLFMTSAAGGYYDDAIDRGMNENQAFGYATIMGIAEGGSEAVISGGMVSKVKTALTGSGLSEAFLNSLGTEIIENFAQEAIMEPLSEGTATLIGGKETANWDNILQRSINAGIDGILSAILLKGVSLGIGSANNVIEKINNNQQVTDQDIKNMINDLKKNDKTGYEQTVQGTVNAIIEQMQNNSTNLQQRQANNITNLQTQQIIQRENKTTQNQTSGQLNDILNNKELPMQSYQYEKSDNVKINNLRQDSNKYFNNTEQAHNFVNMLEKIIIDKNIDIRLDTNLKTADGRMVNGSYSNGVITINPNSTRAGEFIAIHELTHAIGTNSMRNIINEYRKSNAEFNNAVNSLLENYKTTELTDEAMADVAGQLFGNQEFINNLAQTNPTIFRKIYNEIKYLWHQFTGYKNKNQFIEDLQYKWEQAYRSNAKLNETTNYSIAGVEAKNNAIKNDKHFKFIEDAYNEAVRMENEGKTNTEILQNTNWYKDANGDWKFEFSDSDMELKKTNFVSNRVYKLKDVLDHDILYLYYPELKEYNVVFKNKRTGGSYNQNEKLIAIGNNKIDNPAEIKGTLIHEIQHAIQNIEGYSTGTTSKKGWFRYLNTLGEIEAADTKDRFINGYKGVPETAKKNPVHPIIKNSNNIVEKIGNSLYNYFNGGLNYGKENKSNDEENTSRNKNVVELGERSISEIENSNKSSFSMQDNQGRTLTKEQQEYFKDSKVRDENGNLKTLYHGTPYDFNVFSYEKLGENTSSLGAGLYFTDSKKTGKEYTRGNGNLKEVYVDIQKPMSYGKTTMTKKEYKNFIEKINKETNGTYLSDYDGIDNAIMEYEYGGDDIDLVNAVHNASGLSWEKTYEILRETTGFDGIISDKGFLNDGEIIYVAFNSNQIKNVDNTNPTDNQDIRYSQNNQTWQSYLDKNYKATGTRTNLQDIKLSTKNSNKSSINFPNLQDVYKMNNKEQVELLTDEDYSVLNKIYEKEGKTEVLTEKKKANILEKYASDKFTLKDSLDIMAQKFINKGHYIDQLAEKTNNLELKYIYDRNLNSFAEAQYVIGVAQTDNNGKEIGKSINDIWKPIEESKLTKEFSEYLLHKHNIDRSERKKYIFGEEIGPAESTSIALKLEKKYPEFKQYSEDIKKFNHNNLNNLKETGMLTQDTIDYIETMYPNYIAVSRNIEDSLYTGNNDKTGTNDPLKKAVGGNSDIQPIKDAMAEQAIRIKRLINQNNLGKELSKTLQNAQVEENVDIELSPSLLLDMDTMVDTDTNGDKFYLYFEDGKQKKLKIDDNLYESLRPTEISKIEKTLPFKALQKVTSIHKSLLTSSNPIFIVTNFFKDFQDGAFNSKYSSKFIKNYGKALNEIYTKGKYYQSYMANGGMSNTYFDYNEGVKKRSNKLVQNIRNVNEIVEQLPRLAEFISTLEDGKSLNEALYNAAEITTNFKRGGDITKALNRNGVNFLNASIQGLDKQFRNFSGQNGAKGYVNLLAKATIMSIIPSVLNHMLLDDDEDYQDLPQSTKDLYYLFKYDNGKFIRIPKGRVLSVFGAAARRTLETIQGQEDAWNGFGETIANQVAPNNPLENNILAPIIQVENNKTWYGSDLVSSRLQKELPENQYDETTDEFSKWLGKQLKASPKKINYLIDQYSGGIGDILLPMITPQAKQNVFVDKFTTDSVLKNKNVSKFYSTLEKQTQIANDSFATDEDKLQLQYLSSISSDMSDLYKQKREIQMSNISNKEKTEKVRKIQGQINELAEKGLNNYNSVSKEENSSKIGEEQYYKDGKGNWVTLDEEDLQKIGNLSLETYADYKQKVYNQTQEQRKNGDLTLNQNLKNKDKIQILLDSNYSNSEIKNIYENQIKSSKDEQYDILNKTNINIKEYLKYKQQEFESDKEDDGTTIGKTISGSKKKKEYEYVGNMNINYEQKLLLLGFQYSLTNSEKTKLANYVNNLEITKEEKLEIFEKLSGFTVYKNGRVTW